MKANIPDTRSGTRRPVRSDHSISLGALAGALGGLVAALVKIGCEGVVDPRPPGRLPEPEVLIDLIARAHVATTAESLGIHFAFSILAGAIYGALVARYRFVAFALGAAYGIAVWIGAHEIVMPLVRLTPPVLELSLGEQLNEFVTHAIWGVVLELVRHDLVGRWRGQASVIRAT